MATIKGFLKRNTPNGAGLITIKYRYSGKYTIFSTRQKIEPEHWHAPTGYVLPSHRDHIFLNQVIDKYKQAVNTTVQRLILQGILPDKFSVHRFFIDPVVPISRFEQFVNRERLRSPAIIPIPEALEPYSPVGPPAPAVRKPEPVASFFQLLEEWIERNPNVQVRNSTKRQRKSLKNVLDSFQKEKAVTLSFATMDNNFYSSFCNFIVKDRNSRNSNLGKYIKQLKTFLRYAQATHGVSVHPQHTSWRGLSENSPKIALREEEVELIYTCNYASERHRKAADLLALGCWTGLRYSDLIQVGQFNLNQDFLICTNDKTGNTSLAPLAVYPQITSVLRKYDTDIKSMAISNQKFNQYVKEAAQIAGLIDLVEIRIERLGETIKKKIPKWQAISSHTARRTFVTNMRKKGFPPEQVMRMSGHKSYTEFAKYNKLNTQDLLETIKTLGF